MPTLYLECPCGNAIPVKRWRSGKRICTSCGIARAIVHNLQMQAKEGADFDSWKQKMLSIIEETDSSNEE